MIGGAAGDALGYEVEFNTWPEIRKRFGADGVQAFVLNGAARLASISDDTQMTLFTANGLLNGLAGERLRGVAAPLENDIYHAYLEWLRTQGYPGPEEQICWLSGVPALSSCRAPGNTCLSSLASGVMGTIENPPNQSKGCGGVMRVAPVGVCIQNAEQAALLGAKAAAITHGHSLGYMPAAVLAYIVNRLIYTDLSLPAIVRDSAAALRRLFPDDGHLNFLISLIARAQQLAASDMTDSDSIACLGQGWVGEEALAIALYCVLRHDRDFRSTVIAAVNHDGDSDSTGAIAGNIMGARCGYGRIPQAYTENLELRDTILEIADDMYWFTQRPENTESDGRRTAKYASVDDDSHK